MPRFATSVSWPQCKMSPVPFEQPGVKSMEIVELTPTIGAEIRGADLANLTHDQFVAIRQAFLDHQVVFFRDQPRLTPRQQITVAERLGPLHVHPAAPHLDGEPAIFVIHTHRDSKIANGNGWHSDVSCDAEPPLATMLQIHQLPPSGGDTLFASMYAAFEALSPTMQAFLTTLRAHHESEHIYRGRYARPRGD